MFQDGLQDDRERNGRTRRGDRTRVQKIEKETKFYSNACMEAKKEEDCIKKLDCSR